MYTETLNHRFKPVPFPLYDYQKTIVKKALDTILKGENGLIVQPTGTGKTVEAAFIARACILLHKKRGLYIYDANDGLEQARKKFEEIFNGNDISCANFFGYGKEDHVRTANIVFASYQSLNHYKDKAYKTFDSTHFDFIIVNEAHHGEAVTYKEVIQHFTCPKIGMTAVPERQDGKDILNIFDRIIHEILFEEALVKGWIAQIEYHVLSSGLSTQNLKAICEDVLEKGKRITIKQLNESIFVEKLDDEILAEIHKYAFPENKAPLQTLIFCENIRHAEYMLTMLKNYNRSVDVVHSKKGKTHNRNAIRDFKAKKFQFLISVDQLNEDIDIPEVELGVFLRATNSKNIWYQQLGRLLRRTKLKQKAIVLDFVANVERLVAVQELSKRIEEMAKLEKTLIELLPLEKEVLNVSGEGFSFDFSHYMVDILNAVSAIKQGRYATWEEASIAALALGITSSIQYQRDKQYLKDPKLPSMPERFYPNFPGWLTFFGKLVAPAGWMTLNNLYESERFSGVKEFKLFAEKFRETNPEWFKQFRSTEKSKGLYEFCHPDLISLIRQNLKSDVASTASGWMTPTALLKAKITTVEFAVKFTSAYRTTNPDWFQNFFVKGIIREHYHPNLVEKIIDAIEKPKEGWLNIFQLKEQYSIDKNVILGFIKQFRESNSNWFNFYYNKGIHKKVEYYHPDLVTKIKEYFGN